MTPEQAITQIESMKFRPGWTFRASRSWITKPTEVMVWADVQTWDTSYRAADGTLVKPYKLDPGPILIDVAELDEAGLCNQILARLVRPFDDHEDREFLVVPRPGGQWYAPLHPHTEEGNKAWADGSIERAATALEEYVRSAA